MSTIKRINRIEDTLERLAKSSFRNSFHLKENDFKYIEEKGLDTIEKHAKEFVHERLSPAFPKNDGKQTPMKGHPVFVAQHACACCCRGCLEKWYRVKKNIPLTEAQEKKIVNLLMSWIALEVKNHQSSM